MLACVNSRIFRCSRRALSVLCDQFTDLRFSADDNHVKAVKQRNLHQSAALEMFWERDEKSGYGSKDTRTTVEKLRAGFKELKIEMKKFKEESIEKLKADPVMIRRPGETDVVWDFTTDEKLKNWVTTSDKDHGEGFSTCELTRSPTGKGLFLGNLSTKLPKTGTVKKAGYCNMKSIRPRKSFKREIFHDWQLYTHLVLRLRGDGRSYILNLATTGYFDITWNDVYSYILYTRGGPYWQYTKIPFSKFFLTSKGRVQDKQNPVQLDRITGFGISAGDKINGSFRLEVDYIGVVYDPTHKETFAYEMYKMPKFLAGV